MLKKTEREENNATVQIKISSTVIVFTGDRQLLLVILELLLLLLLIF